MALFTAIGAGVAAAAAWFAGLGTVAQFAIRLGAGLAFNALSRALAGDVPKAKAPAIRGELRQGADVPRSFALGSVAIEGSLVYHNTWSFTGEDRAYYTRVTALSDLPIQALERVWVDGVESAIGSSENTDFGFALTAFDVTKTITKTRSLPDPDQPGRQITETYDQVISESRAWVRFYDGTQTTADSLLVDRVSSAERPWPSTSVGTGVAYAVVTFLFDPEQFPRLPFLEIGRAHV